MLVKKTLEQHNLISLVPYRSSRLCLTACIPEEAIPRIIIMSVSEQGLDVEQLVGGAGAQGP
jgi:hypothetical protein